MTWLNRAQKIASKGSTATRARSLAQLHTRRQETGAQFFTAPWVADGIWSLLNDAVGHARAHQRTLHVVDTSVGSGRLLGPAPGDVCHLYGLDVDERCVKALCDDASEAGIHYDFQVGRLEHLTIEGFDIACINPPFSINLQSPLMEPYACCAYGTYGPRTSAISHEYALEQALSAASIVVAVLPTSMQQYCARNARFRAMYELPGDAFRSEAAAVSTAVFVFDAGERQTAALHQRVREGESWTGLALDAPPQRSKPRMRVGALDDSRPSIKLLPTGDTTVRLEHCHRRIVLRFECGLTQAKVMNGLYVADVEPGQRHRYPKGVQYIGQAKLWLDALLLQDDPQAAFDDLLDAIRTYGGRPVVSKTLQGFWGKLKRRHVRAMTPFRHWVKTTRTTTRRAEATRSSLLVEGNIRAPVIRRGEKVDVEPLGGEWKVTKDGHCATLRGDIFDARFRLLEAPTSEPAWTLIEPGLVERFPVLAAQAETRIQAAGITWLWPFQRASLVEHLLKPYGSIAAWKQGTGKARLAIALALLGGKCSLIVVESGLVEEMRKEIEEKVRLPDSAWRIIDRHADPQCLELRQVNVVSFNTLKRCVRGRKTLAKCLRRRFHTVIADEGGILANRHSQQSRALLALAPRKLIVSDGTPIGSYPRDILPVAAAVAGSAVAHQPFGIRDDAYLEPRLTTSANYAVRGVDQFRERHVVLHWVTNEFKDDLSNGAKREVPQIANLCEFRRWLQPNVQRRVRNEPEVEPYAGCPNPILQTTTVQWDSGHLRYYLDVALNFAAWYRDHAEAAKESGRSVNLVAVLARIKAVMMAASCPHRATTHGFGRYSPLTSKQRLAIAKVKENVGAGKKTILYAYSPEVVSRLSRELSNGGIRSVLFHGNIPIAKRTRDLEERFRFGDVDVLLSTWCGQKGLNIPQAKRVIFYDRNWTGRTEDQAIHRTQRPDQDERVIVDRLHIAGSIDEYMGQVVEWKEAAADAGLDWGDGATDSAIFRHLDSIIEEFCLDVLALRSREALEGMMLELPGGVQMGERPAARPLCTTHSASKPITHIPRRTPQGD